MFEWLPSVSQHFMWSALAVLAYVLTTRIARERRAPATAVAWVLALALLPYVTLPLYFAFGRRKIRADRTDPMPARNPSAHWAAQLMTSFGLPPPGTARVRFHENGDVALAAFWELLDGARREIAVSTFLIGNDEVGLAVLARLTQRAREGIKVRLLLDGFGALFAPGKARRELKAAGGSVAVFRPLFALRSVGPRNLRNHRKLLIVDGQRLWAGGRNLAREYFSAHGNEAAWIDLSFDLEGPPAGAAAMQFDRDWPATRRSVALAEPAAAPPVAEAIAKPPAQPPPPLAQPLADTGAASNDFAADAQFLPSGPDQAEDTAQALLVDAFYRAQDRVLAVTPYFVPDDSLRTAMRLAVRRGVQITLVLPERSNHPLADFARARPLRELASAGADVRLVPAMVHAKAVVIDDSLALCGSINLDLRSLLLNHESAVLFYGPVEIDWLARWIDQLVQRGVPYAPSPPSLIRDLAEGMILTVAYQL